jgi:hypothetical protein
VGVFVVVDVVDDVGAIVVVVGVLVVVVVGATVVDVVGAIVVVVGPVVHVTLSGHANPVVAVILPRLNVALPGTPQKLSVENAPIVPDADLPKQSV